MPRGCSLVVLKMPTTTEVHVMKYYLSNQPVCMTYFEQPPGLSLMETQPLRPLLPFDHEYSEDKSHTE